MNIIALYATIMMCLNGQPTVGDQCSDGRPREEVSVSILAGTSSDTCGGKAADIPHQECFDSAKWDSVLKIERNGAVLFDWRADGSVVHDPSFQPDRAADALMASLVDVMKLRGIALGRDK